MRPIQILETSAGPNTAGLSLGRPIPPLSGRTDARCALVFLLVALVVGACNSSSTTVASASISPAIETSAASSLPTASDTPMPTAPPAASTPVPTPSPTPSSGGPVYLKSGTASIQFTVGSKKESLDLSLATMAGMERIDEDGSVYATWLGVQSASGTPQLSLQIPKGASGTYVTNVAAGNMYVTFGGGIINSDVEHISCKVVIKPTPTGGIAGTVDCKGRLRVMLDPVTAKGTFSAEP